MVHGAPPSHGYGCIQSLSTDNALACISYLGVVVAFTFSTPQSAQRFLILLEISVSVGNPTPSYHHCFMQLQSASILLSQLGFLLNHSIKLN